MAFLPEMSTSVYIWRQIGISSTNDAWKFLVERATSLGERHGVEPHEVILGKYDTHTNRALANYFCASYTEGGHP